MLKQQNCLKVKPFGSLMSKLQLNRLADTSSNENVQAVHCPSDILKKPVGLSR